jgi:hypothetical protein
MSTLRVMNLQNASGTGTINVPTGNKLTSADAGGIYTRGQVMQVVVNRVDAKLAYSVGASGNEFTDLRVSITPRFANSMILCTFQVHGEGSGTHDYIMRVYKNGALPSGAYAGYNNVSGLLPYSGIAMPLAYESDYNSTPFTQTMHYHDFPGSTSTLTYAPGVTESSGGSQTYYVNRTVGSTGTNGHETGVSFAIAMEVAQ